MVETCVHLSTAFKGVYGVGRCEGEVGQNWGGGVVVVVRLGSKYNAFRVFPFLLVCLSGMLVRKRNYE